MHDVVLLYRCYPSTPHGVGPWLPAPSSAPQPVPVDIDPIVVPCEGSNLVGHVMPTGVMCQMCGNVWPQFPTPSMFDKVPQHDRLDIVAMVERGDFG